MARWDWAVNGKTKVAHARQLHSRIHSTRELVFYSKHKEFQGGARQAHTEIRNVRRQGR